MCVPYVAGTGIVAVKGVARPLMPGRMRRPYAASEASAYRYDLGAQLSVRFHRVDWELPLRGL